MTSTHSAADLRGISLANLARWDGGPSKTSHIVSFFPIENRLSIASRAARGWEPPPKTALFSTFLMVFSGFFCELAQDCANWRPCGPEKCWF